MKRLFILISILLFSFTSYGQLKVGDAYVKNGLKCVVIKVEGDKAYALKLEEGTSKEIYKLLQSRQKAILKTVKATKALRKQVMSDLASSLNDSGKHTLELMVAYCKENSIDMASVFPDFAEAVDMGEDWFIAGNQELTWLSEFAAEGLGTFKKNPYKNKGLEVMSRVRENEGFEDCNSPFICFDRDYPVVAKSAYWFINVYGGLMGHTLQFELPSRATWFKHKYDLYVMAPASWIGIPAPFICEIDMTKMPGYNQPSEGSGAGAASEMFF